jgi:hypothetical protein
MMMMMMMMMTRKKWKALLKMRGLKYHGMILKGEEGDRERFRKENLADT